ncbi:MAG TPA: hypothetical protein VL241_00320 [Gemmatimonadales bacterium]|nr:hypothetical protein [Gemmatimonadales bacterium]
MTVARWPALLVAGLFAAVLVAPLRAQEVELKPKAKIKHDKYVITAEEIAERSDLKDGFDVIRLLRNQWLRPTRATGGAIGSMTQRLQDKPVKQDCGRNSTDPECVAAASGGGSSGAAVPTERGSPYADADGGGASAAAFLPVIYIDEIKREGVADLRALRPADVFEMRFLTGNQAVGRYGSGHENGAILVKTVRFGRG